MFKHFAWVLGASAALFAQTPTGTIQGTIQDSSGSMVSAAKVTITNAATNEPRSLLTDDAGRYVQPFLLPGTYGITAEKPGFRTVRQDDIKLDVGQNRSVNFTLEVGVVTQEVQVQAAAPPIDMNTSSVGQVIENKRILDLPLNGRSAFSLAGLAPGVNPTGGGATPHMSGSQTSTSEVQIDGATNVTAGVIGGLNHLVYEPQVDAVEEFSVQLNGLAAEYGRFAGGVINVVTKTGTNALHGSAYDFLRNSQLDANNFFANRAGRGKGAFKRNQWGATVGGPVFLPGLYDGRDKTFFFFGFEATQPRTQSVFSGTVPPAEWRAGDFSNLRTAAGAPIILYDPLTGRPDPANASRFIRDPFEGNRIPQARMDPVAVNAMKFFPLPNTAPGNPFTYVNNYVVAGAVPSDSYRTDTRLDHNWNSKWRMFGRASVGWSKSLPLNAYGNDATPGDGSGPNPFTRKSVTLDNTFLFSPTLIGNIRYGFGRLLNDRTPYGDGFDVTSLGLPRYLVEPGLRNVRIFPKMDFAGVLSPLGQNFTLAFEADMDHTVIGGLTKVLSRHTLKMGGEYRKFFVNYYQYCCSSGTFNFNNGWTQQEITTASTTAGHPVASFLLGLPASGQVSHTTSVTVAGSYFAGYLQDDWKLTPKLTVNVGLRYEVERPRTDRFNNLSYFDLNAASPIAGRVPASACTACGDLRGSMRFADAHNRRQLPTKWTSVGPRFGFAYSLNAKTVIRGAYAILYPPSALTAGGASIGVAGFSGSTGFIGTQDSMRTVKTYLRDPFPDGFNYPLGHAGGAATNLGLGPGDAVFLGNETPYVQQWNFNTQRSLPGDLLVEVGYLGSRGINLIDGDGSSGGRDTLNQLPASYMTLGPELVRVAPNPFLGVITNPTSPLSAPTVSYGQLLRPYPHYTGVGIYRRPQAQSVYHALTVRAEKRFSRGLSLLLAYTASKSIDDGSGVAWWQGPDGVNVLDHYNRRLERSISHWDIPQRLVISYVYELPVGKGKRFLGGTPRGVNLLISGWQINGISTFQSGVPLIVNTNLNNTGIFTPGQRPLNNGKSAKITGGTTDERLARWFDTSVFSQPPTFTFGTVGRASPDMRTPGQRNMDLSIFKDTYFGPERRFNLQYRLEMFNAFNTPQFAAPGTTINTGNFGVISGVAVAPRQIQMALKFLW